jgi:hypothetical protein
MIQQQPFNSSIIIPGGKHIPLDPNNKHKHAMGLGGLPPPPVGVGRGKKYKERSTTLHLLSPLHLELKSKNSSW